MPTMAEVLAEQKAKNPYVPHTTGFQPSSSVPAAARAALTAPNTAAGAFDPLANPTVAGAAQQALGGVQRQTSTAPIFGGNQLLGQNVTSTQRSPIDAGALMQAGLADYQAKQAASDYTRNTLVPEAQKLLKELSDTVPANINAAASASKTALTGNVEEARTKTAEAVAPATAAADQLRQRADQLRQEVLTSTETWAQDTLSNFKNTFALETGQRIMGMRAAADQQIQRLDDMANANVGGINPQSMATAKRLINGQLSESLQNQNASVGIEWNSLNAQLHSQMSSLVSTAQQATASMVERGYEAAAGYQTQMAGLGAELEKTALTQRAMNEQGQVSAAIAAEQARLSIGEDMASLIMSTANQPFAGELLPLFTAMSEVFAGEMAGRMADATGIPQGPAQGSEGLRSMSYRSPVNNGWNAGRQDTGATAR